MKLTVAFARAAIPLLTAAGLPLYAGTLPSVSTTFHDQLDVANNEQGPGDLALPTGGSVSLFSGVISPESCPLTEDKRVEESPAA